MGGYVEVHKTSRDTLAGRLAQNMNWQWNIDFSVCQFLCHELLLLSTYQHKLMQHSPIVERTTRQSRSGILMAKPEKPGTIDRRIE